MSNSINHYTFSIWQQVGKAGRRERDSVAVYVAYDGPLDQYFMKYPRKFFGSPIECFQIDAQNLQVQLIKFDISEMPFWPNCKRLSLLMLLILLLAGS